MRAYFALIRMRLKLEARDKGFLFFNFVFPVGLLFGFGEFTDASGSSMTRLVAMVLVLGILGSGLFGAGVRAVVERESGVLRRYKVAPISPGPILVAFIVTGWLLYLPTAVLVIGLGHGIYNMPLPARPISLLLIVTLGYAAFRAIGLIVASVANTVAESNILIQFLYMPMLFLSGATIPVSIMPLWAQITAQFLPASYLNTGMQQVLLESEGLDSAWGPALALLASTVLATWISAKLFRWEKEERIPRSSKLWVAAVFTPFIILGVYQAYSQDHIAEAKRLEREVRRRETRLIRGAHIFVGDGRVIERGSVLIRDGKIERIYEGDPPDASSLEASVIEAAGKTILPGLIDMHVHLGAPGGVFDSTEEQSGRQAAQFKRELAAYLYSGVTAVKSAGDFTDAVLEAKGLVNSGDLLGAEVFLVGPLFTAPGGHGTEYFDEAPEFVREMAKGEFTRLPETAEQARTMVHALKERGVDGIKAVLDAGASGMLFQRMDLSVLKGIAKQAKADALPLAVHTGGSADVAEALEVTLASIEHGSARDAIPDALFAAMKQRAVAYDPTLSVVEAFTLIQSHDPSPLRRTLVEQVAPNSMLAATRKLVESQAETPWRTKLANYPMSLEQAAANLVAAWKAGVTLVTGSDAGNIMVIHGPTVHRELQLWVKAGIPPAAALQAATYNAARLLGADKRIGLIAPGHDATLIIVDGDPLQDITITERISAVLFKGERVDRPGLLNQD